MTQRKKIELEPEVYDAVKKVVFRAAYFSLGIGLITGFLIGLTL